VAISNTVGFCLGEFEVQFTVVISNVECSCLGYFEGYYLVMCHIENHSTIYTLHIHTMDRKQGKQGKQPLYEGRLI